MEITSSNVKNWFRIGSRATFGLTMVELAKEKDDLMVLTADVSTSAGLDRFRKTYEDKFLDVGIAEQNMIGIATGFAHAGYNVFTATFAPFQTMRCCEQIRVNLGYMNTKVTMVGLASGIALGSLGNTHCCFEDMAIMRAIPNLTVLSPADGAEITKAVYAAADYEGPIYIRLTGEANNPIVYKEDYAFQIGKAVCLREGGRDATIIAAGTMVYQSLQAAKLLEEQGFDVAVIDMHTIKPLDKEAINRVCDTSKLIVTAEEHNIIGGLGGAVAEYIATKKEAPPQLFIGISDFFPQAGDYKYMLEQCELTSEQIAQKVKKTLEAV